MGRIQVLSGEGTSGALRSSGLETSLCMRVRFEGACDKPRFQALCPLSLIQWVCAGVQGPAFLMNFPSDPAVAFRRARFENTGLTPQAPQSINALPNSSHPLVDIRLQWGAHSAYLGQPLPLGGLSVDENDLAQSQPRPTSASLPLTPLGHRGALLPGD